MKGVTSSRETAQAPLAGKDEGGVRLQKERTEGKVQAVGGPEKRAGGRGEEGEGQDGRLMRMEQWHAIDKLADKVWGR